MSKYAVYLLKNVINFKASSTRDKERINLLITTNSTGKQGCCIPTDQCCEHHVRKIKDLFKSFHNQLEPSLIEKSVLAYNPSLIIGDHFLDCMGKSELKSGGGHRHEVFSNEEKELIREEISKLNIFSKDTSRAKVIFKVNIRRV